MHIRISANDGVPIYLQIVNQVKYLVASGRLEPGAELSPIRVLAEQLLISAFPDLPGPRLLVLGDMGEVGQQGPQFHAEAGRYAKAKGVTFLAGVGELAQVAVEAFEGAGHSLNMDQLIDTVLGHMPRVRSVLVKGSRFMRMERVVDALMPYAVKNQERRRAP